MIDFHCAQLIDDIPVAVGRRLASDSQNGHRLRFSPAEAALHAVLADSALTVKPEF